jgi:hypothetical protein
MSLFNRGMGGILIVLLAGCASMSKDECLNADWQLIGYEDGASGSAAVRIGEHRKACASHGVVPDKASYDLGYEEGIMTYCSYDRGFLSGQHGERGYEICPETSDYPEGYGNGLISYCTYDVGYREGIDGESYLRVCPVDREADFLAGYELGAEIYDLRAKLHDFEHHLEEVADERKRNDKAIDLLRGKVTYDDELDRSERAEKMAEIKDLEDRNKTLAVERAALYIQIAEVRYKLLQLGVR